MEGTPSPTKCKQLCYLLENFYMAVIIVQMKISGFSHHFTLQVLLVIAYGISNYF